MEEALKELYTNFPVFINKLEFQKLFAIASIGNYELIQDIVNYDPKNFSFSEISPEDMTKKLLEIHTGKYKKFKREIFLNKYFGIPQKDINYIKLFLNSINQADNLSNEFNSKYGYVLQLLNKIFHSGDEDIIKISQTMNTEKKDKYKKIIYECEKEGNDLLRAQFVKDIRTRSRQIVETAEHKTIITNEGKEIDVYELSGQPFTMLVHIISHNKGSEHDHLVNNLINNPQNWEEISSANNYISASLITDKYMSTYGNPKDI